MGCCGDANDVEPVKINGRELVGPKDDFAGPVKDRTCRDVLMLIIFIAFCVVGIIYLIVAATKGDVNRVIHGYDNYGNVCGQNNNNQWCFKNLSQSCKDMTKQPFLHLNYDLQQLIRKNCTQTCSDSSQLFGYQCIEIPMKAATKSWKDSANRFFESLAGTLRRLWGYIVATCIVGFVLSFIFALLLRFLAAVIVWITVFIIAVGSIVVTIVAWVYWAKYKDMEGIDKNTVNGILLGAITATVFTVLTLILLIAMRNRIRLVIQLFIEAGKAVAAMPQLLLQPIVTLFFLIIVVAIWAAGWLVIESSGDPYVISSTSQEVGFKMDQVISGMRWYYIFGFLWVTQFVLACQSVVIAGAVATWYFSREKSNLGSPVMASTGRLIMYHLGSVAFGSLIIAIVKLIRLILKYIEKKFASGNDTLKWCLCCCQCLLACFENYLKYLTRNAYIEIAIYGYSFCEAAKKAFNIIANNALRVATINFVGDFVLILIKIAVIVATGFIGWEILKSGYPDNNGNYTELIGPMIVSIFFVYLIVYSFISVYEMTIDTLFVCFCEDCERNDGLEKPYFMSKGLMQFVENSKKALEALDQRKNEAKNMDAVKSVTTSGMYPSTPVFNQPPPYSASINGSEYTYHMRTGMTPLHPGYPPVSEPPSPSQFLSRPA